MERGIIVETRPLDVYEQMAADEAMCDRLPAPYILRFYNWAAAGITFGYSQRYRSVKEALGSAAPVGMVRRPTGGGIVRHENDLTFSFIFRSPGVYFEPAKTYDRLHKAIRTAYEKAGASFDLMGEKTADYSTNDPVMDCFAKPVNMDILYNGKKVLGGALRKFGDNMLYQASFQAEDARANAAFHRKTVIKALAEEFSLSWESVAVTREEEEALSHIADTKYRTKAWNERI